MSIEMRNHDRRSAEKMRHASYLFEEMGKFQKVGILCDITLPGKLEVVPAHKIVLMSTRSSEGDHPKTPLSPENEKTANFYLPDDVFQVDEAYSSNTETLEHYNDGTKSVSDSVEDKLCVINDFRHKHCYCDVTLVVDGCKCDAHKVVLAACSGYFRGMFTSSMRENTMDNICLHGIDVCYFRRIINYMYTGEACLKDFEDAVELLKIAVFYQILPLVKLCKTYLLESIDSESACLLCLLGRELALKDFLQECRSYLHGHFIELDNPDKDVDLLHHEDLLACLPSDTLGGTSNSQAELCVLRVVLRWLLANHSTTPENVLDLIVSYVRFALIPANRIMSACGAIMAEQKDNVQPEMNSDFTFGDVFRRHLLSALKYHENVHKQPIMQSHHTNLRTPAKQWVSVDGVLAPLPIKLPSGLNEILPENSQQGDVPIRDPFHSVVELNGFIYIIGGTRIIDEGYSRIVIRYDPRLNTCLRVAEMNEPRGDFVAVALGGYVYAIGGRNRTGALDTTERYDPNSNTWEYVASLPECIYMAAGVECNGKIYVCGGFNDYETVGMTLCYDPELNEWEQIFSPMMADRGYHVMIQGHDGRLWVMGGVDNPFSGRNVWEVEAFDLESGMWNFVGQILPVPLFLSTIRLNVLLNKDNHICISAVTLPEKYTMLEYNPEKRMWFDMKVPVNIHSLHIY